MPAGRNPIGDKPMTNAERKRRQREKAKTLGVPLREQVVTAYGRALIDIAPEIKDTQLYLRIEKLTDMHLSNLGFKRRPIQDVLKQVKEGGGTD